eukprot:7087020-Prymnesium_polylepis.2
MAVQREKGREKGDFAEKDHAARGPGKGRAVSVTRGNEESILRGRSLCARALARGQPRPRPAHAAVHPVSLPAAAALALPQRPIGGVLRRLHHRAQESHVLHRPVSV